MTIALDTAERDDIGAAAEAFVDLINARRSIRAFRPDPVSRDLVEELLRQASRSPSGTNVQPWHVEVVMGAARDRLVSEILAFREANRDAEESEFPTSKRKEPYLGRMRTLGKAMYGLIGIEKGDTARMWEQWGRNYKFFDAPVGLIFTIDKDLGPNSWLDIGMFMQTLMLAARAHGLDTCPQGAWHRFYPVTKRVLGIPEDHYVCCGMALGYADRDDPVNRLQAEREPLSAFATFHTS